MLNFGMYRHGMASASVAHCEGIPPIGNPHRVSLLQGFDNFVVVSPYQQMHKT